MSVGGQPTGTTASADGEEGPAPPVRSPRRRPGQVPDWAVAVAANAVALVAALAASAAVVALYGRPVGPALRALWDGAFGSSFAVGNTLNKAAPLLLVALAFIVALRAGLVSIGGEGQLHLGALGATAVALGTSALPVPVGLVLALAGGALGGALWGGLAGWLRARLAVNEVISTLLLNFVGISLVGLAVQETWLLRQPIESTTSFPQTPAIDVAVRLPRLLIGGASRLHAGILLALLLAALVAWALRSTVIGYRLRMLGLNPVMAARSGVDVRRFTIGALAGSGALAGLAGTSLILGEQFRLREGFSPGFGFDGIAVALLARQSPLGAVLAAVLFGGLRAGGLNMEAAVQVPQAIALVVQGAVILVVAGTTFALVDRRRRLELVAATTDERTGP